MYSDTLKMIVWRKNVDVFTKVDRSLPGTLIWRTRSCFVENLPVSLFCERYAVGLELNSKKTEVMVLSRKEEPPLINITINSIKLKQRDHFKYLGALVSSDGRNNTEISARIAQAKMMFQKMKTVLTNSHISIQTRKRTLECYIEPILIECEAWTISKQAQKKLEAVKMLFLRRMMKISWMTKKSNDTVLKEAHTSRALVNKIRTRQTTFFGHVMRRES